MIIIQGAQNFWGIGIGNHGRPWACEREGPVHKKMLWKAGVYSHLSERLIGYGRDRAFRPVVSDTDTPKVLLEEGHKKNRPLCAPIGLDYLKPVCAQGIHFWTSLSWRTSFTCRTLLVSTSLPSRNLSMNASTSGYWLWGSWQ